MEEQPSEVLPTADVSPLRELLMEAHEVHTELRAVGFTDKQATSIVAFMVSDVLNSRDEVEYDIELVDVDDDDLDEDDLHDDGDTGQ